MRGNAVGLVVLTLAVALAGCSGLVPGEDDGGGAATEPTPAPVPTDGESLPPGVSDDGIVVNSLIDAHERRLEAGGYTSVSEQRVTGVNGTMWESNHTRQVASGEQAFVGRVGHRVVEFPLGEFPDTYEYWSNGSVYASRRVLSTSSFYGWSRIDQREDIEPSPLLDRVLRATSVRVVDRESGVLLRGTELRRPSAFPNPPYLRDPHNVSLTVRVTEDGVVTRWRLAYDATIEDRTVRVRRVARISDIGSTTVRRPDWVDTARERIETVEGESTPAE